MNNSDTPMTPLPEEQVLREASGIQEEKLPETGDVMFTEEPVSETVQQVPGPAYVSYRQPGKISTLFFCLWVIIALLLVQTFVSVAGVIPVAIHLLLESGLDMDHLLSSYSNLLNESSLLAWLQLAATAAGALVAGLWYYFGYVRKDTLSGTYRSVMPQLKNTKLWLFLITGTIACYTSALLLDILACELFPEMAEALSETMELALGRYTWIGLFVAVCLAPIGEECAVRGIIVRRSERVFGLVGCMIISAVFFGLLHMNLIQGIYVLPTGAFLGFVSYKTRSVLPCIFCHMLFNLVGMTLPLEFEILDPILVFAAILVCFGAAAVVFGRQWVKGSELTA